MDEEVRKFREARERASHAAQDFLAANPHCAGVIVVRDGLAVHRDASGCEQVRIREQNHEPI